MKKRIVTAAAAAAGVLVVIFGIWIWRTQAAKIRSNQGFYIMSKNGFDKEDITVLSQLDGVIAAEGVYEGELLLSFEEAQRPVKAVSLHGRITACPLNTGRLPETTDEILINAVLAEKFTLKVGQALPVAAGEGEDLRLYHEKLIIAGICEDGNPEPRLYLHKDHFHPEGYAAIVVYGEKGKEALVAEEMTQVAEARAASRYETLTGRLQRQMEEKRRLAEYLMEELTQKLRQAEKELADAKDALDAGKRELEKGKQELEQGKTELQQGEEKMEEGKQQLEYAAAQLDNAEAELSEKQSQLADLRRQLDEGKAEYTAALNKAGIREDQLESTRDTINGYLTGAESTLETSRQVKEDRQAALDNANAALNELNESRDAINSRIAELEADPSQGRPGEIFSLYAERSVIESRMMEQGLRRQEAQISLSTAEATYDAALSRKAELEAQKSGVLELMEARDRLAAGEATYAESKRQLEEARALLDSKYGEYARGQNAFDEGKKTYEEGQFTLMEKEAQYNAGVQTYEEKQAEYEEGIRLYQEGLSRQEALYDELEKELEPIRQELAGIVMEDWVITSVF